MSDLRERWPAMTTMAGEKQDGRTYVRWQVLRWQVLRTHSNDSVYISSGGWLTWLIDRWWIDRRYERCYGDITKWWPPTVLVLPYSMPHHAWMSEAPLPCLHEEYCWSHPGWTKWPKTFSNGAELLTRLSFELVPSLLFPTHGITYSISSKSAVCWLWRTYETWLMGRERWFR